MKSLVSITALSLMVLGGPALADGKGHGKGHKSHHGGHVTVVVPHAVAFCPPGLAKKNPPCIPPGQAKKMAPVETVTPDVTVVAPTVFTDVSQIGTIRILRDDPDRDRANLIGGSDMYLNGQIIDRPYLVLDRPTQYGLPDGNYYVVNNYVYRVDPRTMQVMALIGIAEALM